jgi:hypothetical protein
MNTSDIDKRIESTKVKIENFYTGQDQRMIVMENQVVIMEMLKDITEKLESINNKLRPIRGFDDITLP